MKEQLIQIKEEAENIGLSARRVQARLMDAVKKAGMVNEEGIPTIEARNLVREVQGQEPLKGIVGLSGCVER